MESEALTAGIRMRFRMFCYEGRLELAQDLVDRFDQLKFIDIYNIFTNVCKAGQYLVAKWLFNLCIYNEAAALGEGHDSDLLDDGSEINGAEIEYNATNEVKRCIAIAFYLACDKNHIKIAKWLCKYATNNDIDIAFTDACCRLGYLPLAQWFYNQRLKDDGYMNYDDAFKNACDNGHATVAAWLFAVYPTICIVYNEHAIFKTACKRGHLSLVKWLHSIKPNLYHYEYVVEHTGDTTSAHLNWLVEYWPNYRTNTIKFNSLAEDNRMCVICHTTKCNAQTDCGHNYCVACLTKWLVDHYECPYCRNSIEYLVKIV